MNSNPSQPACQRPTRPRRSVLYVPGGNERAIAKAWTLDCDAVIFDLEDSVAPDAKSEARENLRTLLKQPLGGGRETIIRINPLASPWGAEDLLAARGLKPDAILIPKVDSPEAIAEVDDALDQTDAPDTLRLWAMIETPKGIMNAGQIARAARTPDCRLDCFVTGTNDIIKETGVAPLPGRPYLSTWLMEIVLAARAYGLDALDGVYNDFRDMEGFAAECAQGRAMGFDGKTLIHPGQIGTTNEAFGIDAAQLEEARAIVATFARPENARAGVISLDGRMVERLHAEMAEKLIAKADALAARASD